MIYSFLETLQPVLVAGLSGKAQVTLGARPSADDAPNVHLRAGKLHWGQKLLDAPTFSQTEQATVLGVHRPFEQSVWIDVTANTPSLVATLTAFVTSICLTESDAIIKRFNQPKQATKSETYQSVWVVKTVQWLSHKPNEKLAPFTNSLKINVLGDFKAMKRTTESEPLIQTVLLNENR
jgi:hypothetical protein